MTRKEKMRLYQQTPEFKARGRIRRQDPEFKANRKKYMDEYSRRPESKRKQKNYNLMRCYGITIDEYETMMSRQGGVCACCGGKEWGPKGPGVDHNHETGKIRGILCGWCNCAAGYLGDNPGRIRMLADYIDKHNEEEKDDTGRSNRNTNRQGQGE